MKKKLTIRLPEEKIQEIEQLVEEGKFQTVSEAIRKAIETYIEPKQKNLERVVFSIPKNLYNELKEFVNMGEALSLEDVLMSALREHITNRLKEIEERQMRFESVRKEIRNLDERTSTIERNLKK
ncbi:MAG: ribbon-helix-helix domain-containing protein [Candidatus Thermoplasmatota archaeon]